MKKNNKYSQGILVGILICLVLGLSTFIIYDKLFNNDNPDNQKGQNTEVAVTLSQTEKEDLLEQIDKYNFSVEITEQYPISDVNNFTNSSKLSFLESMLDNYYETFTKEQLENIKNNYFYEGFTVLHADITCPILEHKNQALYKYDSATGNYTYREGHAHDGGDFNIVKSYYVGGSYNESTKLYTFDIKVLYGKICAGVCTGISESYYDSPKRNNVVYRSGDSLEDFDEVYPKVESKLPVTKYSFYKNDNGKFVLKAVTY